MQIETSSKELVDFGKRNIIPISLGILGLLLLIAGIFQVFTAKNTSPELVFEASEEKQSESIELIVDISGAVINPGVYKLKSNSRMVDALAIAGGLSSEADRDYVEKNINLAGKITDGLKIYIPRVGEDVAADAVAPHGNTGGQVLNINLATSTDLETLPGIGEVTAQKIIEGRPYSSIEELQSRSIIGVATYEKIKDKIAAN